MSSFAILGTTLALLLTGCSSSHATEPHPDAGRDGGSAADAPLGCDAPVSCWTTTTLVPGCCMAPRLSLCLDECPIGLVADEDCTSIETLCLPDAGPKTCGMSEWMLCERPSQCRIEAAGCCDSCSRPTIDMVDAVRDGAQCEHHEAVCPEACTGMESPCLPCAPVLNPDLIATCTEAGCEAEDIHALPLSSCTTDEDCRVRATPCCECGADTSPMSLIAIRIDSEGAYAELVCDPGMGCDDCVPMYPSEAQAFCDSTGHCAVSISE